MDQCKIAPLYAWMPWRKRCGGSTQGHRKCRSSTSFQFLIKTAFSDQTELWWDGLAVKVLHARPSLSRDYFGVQSVTAAMHVFSKTLQCGWTFFMLASVKRANLQVSSLCCLLTLAHCFLTAKSLIRKSTAVFLHFSHLELPHRSDLEIILYLIDRPFRIFL